MSFMDRLAYVMALAIDRTSTMEIRHDEATGLLMRQAADGTWIVLGFDTARRMAHRTTIAVILFVLAAYAVGVAVLSPQWIPVLVILGVLSAPVVGVCALIWLIGRSTRVFTRWCR